jgi:hypothetical protein
MVVSGRLPAGNGGGPVPAHLGDEVLRIISGEIIVRVGDERRLCAAGDVAVVPPNVLHGFQVVQDTLTLFPVRQPDGSRRLVEVYRADLPWCAPPPRPGQYTTDEALQQIIRSVDIQV